MIEVCTILTLTMKKKKKKNYILLHENLGNLKTNNKRAKTYIHTTTYYYLLPQRELIQLIPP